MSYEGKICPHSGAKYITLEVTEEEWLFVAVGLDGVDRAWVRFSRYEAVRLRNMLNQAIEAMT